MQIPQLELAEWVETLKIYQRKSIDELLEKNDAETAAKLWLSANGASSTKQFGGNGNPEPFWDRFVAEFKSFICGDEKYNKDRERLSSQTPIPHEIFVSVISGAIGSTIGFAASLLAPVVAILLYQVGKLGIAAYCKCT